MIIDMNDYTKKRKIKNLEKVLSLNFLELYQEKGSKWLVKLLTYICKQLMEMNNE